jgi:hypothetical protein
LAQINNCDAFLVIWEMKLWDNASRYRKSS